MLNKHEESVLNCWESCERGVTCALSEKCNATGVCLREKEPSFIRKMQLVLESAGGDRIYAAIFVDKSTLKKTVGLAVSDNEGNYSDIIHYDYSIIDDKDIMNKLISLADYGKNIRRIEDIEGLAEYMEQHSKKLPVIDGSKKTPFKEICQILLEHYKKFEEGLINEKESDFYRVSREGSYFSIVTEKFKGIAEDENWEPKKLKEYLLERHLLKIGKGRSFDSKLSNGKWAICLCVAGLREWAK